MDGMKIMRAYRTCSHKLMMECTCFVGKGHSDNFFTDKALDIRAEFLSSV